MQLADRFISPAGKQQVALKPFGPSVQLVIAAPE